MANYFCISSSFDGWTNLAVDEWFLDHLSPEDMLLYFYTNENAVIIGKNQNPWKECSLSAMEADGVQLVRRCSGGGAVFHDRGNLNFSFLCGEGRYDTHKQLEVILQAVRSFGIPCEFSGRNDLLAAGRKFSGNAFCSRGGIRQHHGTLLLCADLSRLQNYLNPDPRKLQAKGVSSVRSRVCNLTEFVPDLTSEKMQAAVIEAFQQVYGKAQPLPFDPAQAAQYREKQASWQWRLGKTPAFDLELDTRFAWGGVQILLQLKDGVVAAAKVFSDAMDPDFAQQLQDKLTGCPCRSAELATAVRDTADSRLCDVADFLLEEKL